MSKLRGVYRLAFTRSGGSNLNRSEGYNYGKQTNYHV